MQGAQKAYVGAAVAAVIAFLGAVLGGLQSLGDGASVTDLDAAVWITAVIAALTALSGTGAGVYRVTNRPADDLDEPDELDDLLYREE